MASWEAWKSRLLAVVATGLLSTQAMADPMISVPLSATATQGSSFTVSVSMFDAVDLYGYQFSLSFNPAVLQATSVTEGSFLGTAGSTFFGPGTINNTTGTISFVFDALIGPGPGATGNGVIANINFMAANAGFSTLGFSNVLAQNSDLATLNTQILNGSVTVTAVPEPAAYLMFGAGLAGLAVARRRKVAATV